VPFYFSFFLFFLFSFFLKKFLLLTRKFLLWFVFVFSLSENKKQKHNKNKKHTTHTQLNIHIKKNPNMSSSTVAHMTEWTPEYTITPDDISRIMGITRGFFYHEMSVESELFHFVVTAIHCVRPKQAIKRISNKSSPMMQAVLMAWLMHRGFVTSVHDVVEPVYCEPGLFARGTKKKLSSEFELELKKRWLNQASAFMHRRLLEVETPRELEGFANTFYDYVHVWSKSVRDVNPFHVRQIGLGVRFTLFTTQTKTKPLFDFDQHGICDRPERPLEKDFAPGRLVKLFVWKNERGTIDVRLPTVEEVPFIKSDVYWDSRFDPAQFAYAEKVEAHERFWFFLLASHRYRHNEDDERSPEAIEPLKMSRSTETCVLQRLGGNGHVHAKVFKMHIAAFAGVPYGKGWVDLLCDPGYGCPA
jgi:hypothetical protein